MRRTKLRSDDTHERYVNAQKNPNFFEDAETLVDFKYWRVINNEYPYDAIATTHHMLIPKREFQNEWDMNIEEITEMHSIKRYHVPYVYDVWWLNMPHSQSAPQRLHYHLLVLKEI